MEIIQDKESDLMTATDDMVPHKAGINYVPNNHVV
jgi:hypothetical protein